MAHLTPLEHVDDHKWLRETHLKGLTLPAFAIAVIEGNEDCPIRIMLYARNHYACIPTVYTYTDAGYVITQKGE